MIGPRNHNRNLGSVVAQGHANAHPKFNRGHLLEASGFIFGCPGSGRLPLHTLEKDVFLPVKMLIGVKDVPSPMMNPTRYFRNKSRLIGAVKQGDDRTVHGVDVY